MSPRPHLDRALLDDYFQGRTSSHDLLAEVARLLEAECEDCKAALATRRAAYRRALREAGRRVHLELAALEEEEARVPALLRELPDTGPEALLQAASDPRLHTVAFVRYQLAAAWGALRTESWSAARLAADLAAASSLRLGTARYGKTAVARLQAEADLAVARAAHADGRHREATTALDALERRLPETRSGDLEAGLLLARAVQELGPGDPGPSRRHLLNAEALCRDDSTSRWRPSVQILLAILERRRGRPEAAATRLRDLLASPNTPAAGTAPPGPGGWRAAHELVAALLATGNLEEAGSHVAAWDHPGSRTSIADPSAAAELTHLRALLLRAQGRPEPATAALLRAYRAHLALGRGLRAAGVVCDLARIALETAPGPLPAAWVARAVETLVTRRALSLAAVEPLARFGSRWGRGTLRPEEIDLLEGDLLLVDPPWEPADHAPG